MSLTQALQHRDKFTVTRFVVPGYPYRVPVPVPDREYGFGVRILRHTFDAKSMMDIDEVLQRIGGLGLVQKKIFFFVSAPHVWNAFHVLALAYIGTDPGWKCSAPKTQHSGHVGVAVESPSDPDAKCAYYEQGECSPEFSKEYTSIVTEVGKEHARVCHCAPLSTVL